MKTSILLPTILPLIMLASCVDKDPAFRGKPFRAPATPLVTIDPYTSIWSFGDKLNEQPTLHWTGMPHPLNGLVRVDGKVYRFLGSDPYEPVPGTATTIKYTTSRPSEVWMMPGYEDSLWTDAAGPVGSAEIASREGTFVDDDTIWIRQRVTLEDVDHLKLKVNASKGFIWRMVIYLNGAPATALSQCSDDMIVPLGKKAQPKLREGVNFLGIYLQRRSPRQKIYADVGFVKEQALPKAEQLCSQMTATRSRYRFNCGGVDLQVDFLSPLLMDDLDLLSRPVNYITFQANSCDGLDHDVQVCFDASPLLAVHTPDQEVVCEKIITDGTEVLKAGTVSQEVLGREGDNVRIDWGYLLLVPGPGEGKRAWIGAREDLWSAFSESGGVPGEALPGRPAIASEAPVLATTLDMGSVGRKPRSSHVMIGYDDLYAIEYFGEPLRAWWKRDGMGTMEMLGKAEKDYREVVQRCDAFDAELYREAFLAGGERYANLCVLAYRQAISAHKLVAGPDGFPLFFSKENFSNGSIGTVDVTYPSAPLFLLYGPDLLKGMLEPIFYYSESGKWTKPIAAHDVGKYPLANGQRYREDMPVEECGNMIILTAAIGEVEGDYSYAERHWETLTTWAEYLKEKGFDPENQLCTDDFAGHLAHNANLSVKAIVALGAFAKMAVALGRDVEAGEYGELAKGMVEEWTAAAGDGDHYSLTFDRKGTWSQKYNLVWDRLLGLELFPDEVVKKELAYYLTMQNKYGLPLDSRSDYTKSDWIMWTAAMAGDRKTFETFVDPVYLYATEGLNRQPVSDWHNTNNGWVTSFRARSVVGGYYMKVLADRMTE